jgi:signal peptidase II
MALTPANKNLALKRFYFMLSIGLMVVAVDQATKMTVMNSLKLYEIHPVIPGLFNFTYLHNSGAAFGFLASVSGVWKQWFFIGVSVAALAFILFLYAQYCLETFLYTVALGLIGGGAVGNVLDRVRYGSVIDFLDFYIGSHHWPAFNMADSAICVGVGLFLLANMAGTKAK